MRLGIFVILAATSLPLSLAAQGLRSVPQRYVHLQPAGLLLGIGTAGLEVAVGRTTTVELGGIGVYTEEDGFRIYGGGGGVGVRHFLGSGEPAGAMIGARVDGLWLVGENPLRREGHPFLGVGVVVGHRWVTRTGLLVEPVLGYEFLIGPEPLVGGTRALQEDLGLIVGISLGWAW